MISWIVKKLATSILSRWILGSLVALILGWAGMAWHNFKERLVHQGQQVCVQEINKQTVIDLQAALAAEKVVSAALHAMAVATAEQNAEAKARLSESESRVASLLTERKEQEKTDETYADWSNTALPDGVARRLRDAAAGSDPDTGRDDGN